MEPDKIANRAAVILAGMAAAANIVELVSDPDAMRAAIRSAVELERLAESWKFVGGE